jgi:dTDP-4-dehydrorhamnose 3,5-epimerase-like enzyme
MRLIDKIQILPRKIIKDERGVFIKPMTGLENFLPDKMGEIYITTANPGAFRGNHYHKKTSEWFTVFEGKALLILEDPNTKEHLELEANFDNLKTFYIPAGIAHVFYNPESNTDRFSLIAYADNIYDPEDTITYKLV